MIGVPITAGVNRVLCLYFMAGFAGRRGFTLSENLSGGREDQEPNQNKKGHAKG
jgi:hypothetical protein